MKTVESILKIIIVALALVLIVCNQNNPASSEKVNVSELAEKNRYISGSKE